MHFWKGKEIVDLENLAEQICDWNWRRKKPQEKTNCREGKPFKDLNALLFYLKILQWHKWRKFKCILPFLSKWLSQNAIFHPSTKMDAAAYAFPVCPGEFMHTCK